MEKLLSNTLWISSNEVLGRYHATAMQGLLQNLMARMAVLLGANVDHFTNKMEAAVLAAAEREVSEEGLDFSEFYLDVQRVLLETQGKIGTLLASTKPQLLPPDALQLFEDGSAAMGEQGLSDVKVRFQGSWSLSDVEDVASQPGRQGKALDLDLSNEEGQERKVRLFFLEAPKLILFRESTPWSRSLCFRHVGPAKF